MAVIAKVVYDHNRELVLPSRSAIEAAKSSLDLDFGQGGARATDDVDYTHVIEISDSGRTPTQARHNVAARIDRFLDTFEGKYGFRKLYVRKLRQSTTAINSTTTITYEVVYAIEYRPSRPRTHEPESPHAGFRRDTSPVARRSRKLTAL